MSKAKDADARIQDMSSEQEKSRAPVEHLPNGGIECFFGNYRILVRGRYDHITVVDALRPLFAEG